VTPAAPALVVVLVAVIAAGTPALARVSGVTVESRTAVLGGAPFGPGGAYEKLTGTIELELDPASPANARIVDLGRAPRNAAGRVEARANFMVLQPTDRGRDRRIALLEVSNRGGKAALAYFNGARWSLDPVAREDFGDGLLMRLGLTVIWVGWQFDVPRRPGLLRLDAPVATGPAGEGRESPLPHPPGAGAPIEGLVRSDWVVDHPVTTLPLGHRGHIPYPLVDPAHPGNVLTVREGRLGPRAVVPRNAWRFGREVGGRTVDDREHITMPAGFQPGKIYELVYRARDPAVVGLGLAAIRDVMAHARHDPGALFPARHGVAFGVSQTGRFLRHFLYQGFNTDEAGRQVFEGMLIHTAGAGRGSFNHRFAQPSRDAHRFSAFFFPTDLFPFTGRSQRDPETGAEDGLLARGRPEHLPKVFSTNTGYEYWGRAASLIHTTPDGRADVEPLPQERIYHLAGGQHFVGEFPPPPEARITGAPAWRGNPLDFLPALRALLARLVAWVAGGVEPPASAYPRVDAGTLVPVERLAFPAVPGVSRPSVVHEAHRVDYGPRWPEGIVTLEPPRVGAPFRSLVPQVDGAGNEVGGVRSVELLAPLATYAPWNLRTPAEGAPGELSDFYGTYIPFPRTETERRRAGDPRPPLESLYPTRADYLRAAAAAARSLVAAGFLLDEDQARVLDRAGRHWDGLAR
jgi:hypothetical protein